MKHNLLALALAAALFCMGTQPMEEKSDKKKQTERLKILKSNCTLRDFLNFLTDKTKTISYFLQNKDNSLEILLATYNKLLDKNQALAKQIMILKFNMTPEQLSDRLAKITQNKRVVFVTWDQARKYFRKLTGSDRITDVDFNRASERYLSLQAEQQSNITEETDIDSNEPEKENTINRDDHRKSDKPPAREKLEEFTYVVFVYEGETDEEPALEFTPDRSFQEQELGAPEKDTVQEPDETSVFNRANSQEALQELNKIAGSNQTNFDKDTLPSGQPNRGQSNIPAGAGMTSGKKIPEHNYNWHDISDEIPVTCLATPAMQLGIRKMWLGCRDSIEPHAVEPSTVPFVWILVHGTWGHRTPSFFDETNKNFKEIRACIKQRVRGKNALLLSYRWSGENTVRARKKGARQLMECLAHMELLRQDIPLAIVAHSHGCNLSSRFSRLLEKKGSASIATLLYFACPRRPEQRFQPQGFDNLVYFWGPGDLIASLGSISWDKVTANLKSSWIFRVSDQAIYITAGGLDALGYKEAGSVVKVLGKLQIGKAMYCVYQVITQRAVSPDFSEDDALETGNNIRIGTKVDVKSKFDILKPVNIHSDIVNSLGHLRVIFKKFHLFYDSADRPESGKWSITMNKDASGFTIESAGY